MKKMILIAILFIVNVNANDSFKKITCEAISAQKNGETSQITKRQAKANDFNLDIEYNDYKMRIKDGFLYSAWVETGVYSRTKGKLDYYSFKEQKIYKNAQGNWERGKTTNFSLVINPTKNILFVMMSEGKDKFQFNFQCKAKKK